MTNRAIPEAAPPEPTSATLEGTLALGRALHAHDARLPPRLTSLPFLRLRGSRSVPGAARGLLPPGLPWTIGMSPKEAALLEAWQREPSEQASSEREPLREDTAPSPDEVGLPLSGFALPPMSRPLAQLARTGDSDSPPPLVVGTRASSPPAPTGHPRSSTPAPELPARASLTSAFAENGVAPGPRSFEDPAPLPPLVVGTRVSSPLVPTGHPPSAASTPELPARTSLTPAARGASPPPPRLDGQLLPGQTSGPLLPQAVGLAEAVQGLVQGTVTRAMEEASRKAPPPPAPTPPAAPPPVDVSSDTFVRGLASRLRALAQEERFRGGLIR